MGIRFKTKRESVVPQKNVDNQKNSSKELLENSIEEEINDKENVEIEEIKEIDENGERGIENEEDSKNSDLEESVLEDEDISSTDFSLMSKDELESWARENIDLELDKRKKKSDLISEIKEALK